MIKIIEEIIKSREENDEVVNKLAETIKKKAIENTDVMVSRVLEFIQRNKINDDEVVFQVEIYSVPKQMLVLSKVKSMKKVLNLLASLDIDLNIDVNDKMKLSRHILFDKLKDVYYEPISYDVHFGGPEGRYLRAKGILKDSDISADEDYGVWLREGCIFYLPDFKEKLESMGMTFDLYEYKGTWLLLIPVTANMQRDIQTRKLTPRR